MSARTVLLFAPFLFLFLFSCPSAPPPSEEGDPTAAESFHFDADVAPLPLRRSTVPILILAPAGDQIALTAYSASATVARDTASTELLLTFAEPTPAGARLSLRLPRKAEVKRLAAKLGDAWKRAGESEPADRPEIPMIATEHRFAPVLPAGTRTVKLTYTEPLDGRYQLALFGLPELESFQATVRTSTATIERYEQRWRPAWDLELRTKSAGVPAPEDLRPVESLMVLIDSSASSAADWERRVATVRALVEALGRGEGPETLIHLTAFDQLAERLYEGAISGLTPEVWQRLSDRGAFGASNFARAFSQLGAQHKFARALLVSDGVFTVGNLDPAAMVASIRPLSNVGVKRFDVLAFGDERDDRLLASLAAASPSEPGAVIDGDLPLSEIARRLNRAAPVDSPAAPSTPPIAPAFFQRFAGRIANPPKTKPVLGPLHRERWAEIAALDGTRLREGLEAARAWNREAPLEPLPLLALGDIYAALNDTPNAARAFGSLVDLYPAQPEVLQLAACRLETLREEAAIKLSLDLFDKALLLAPDRPWSHRLFAWALLKAHQEALALAVLDRGAKHLGFGPVQSILREDAGVIAAAWIKKEPQNRQRIIQRLIPLGATVANQPSLSFSLYWSADADVDLVVRGAKGPPLAASTDALRYGPEVVTIRRSPHQRAYPYRTEAVVHGLGALGVTAGKLEVMEHDGRGGIWFAVRSFVLTRESGVVDLGSVDKPFGKARGP